MAKRLPTMGWDYICFLFTSFVPEPEGKDFNARKRVRYLQWARRAIQRADVVDKQSRTGKNGRSLTVHFLNPQVQIRATQFGSIVFKTHFGFIRSFYPSWGVWDSSPNPDEPQIATPQWQSVISGNVIDAFLTRQFGPAYGAQEASISIRGLPNARFRPRQRHQRIPPPFLDVLSTSLLTLQATGLNPYTLKPYRPGQQVWIQYAPQSSPSTLKRGVLKRKHESRIMAHPFFGYKYCRADMPPINGFRGYAGQVQALKFAFLNLCRFGAQKAIDYHGLLRCVVRVVESMPPGYKLSDFITRFWGLTFTIGTDGEIYAK